MFSAAGRTWRPNALLARGQDAVRVEGCLQRLEQPPDGVVAERVLLLDEVHERDVRAVEPVAARGALADERGVDVERRAHLRLVERVEDDRADVDQAALREDERGPVVEPGPAE